MTNLNPTVDYDSLLKDFVAANFADFLAFAVPDLHAEVDWDEAIEFLDQELINALKGKYRVRGKKKRTDRLVKLRLHSGHPHLVLVHVEFEQRPKAGFALRMYEYRTLIALRYGSQHITGIAVFSGSPPPQRETQFEINSYGSQLYYQFISIIAARADEHALIKARNPFALALLTAKFAWQSRRDPLLRFSLKKKVFELGIKSGISRQKMIEILIFVRDFAALPQPLENEFERQQLSLIFENAQKMAVSEGTKRFAERIYAHVFGQTPDEILEAERQKIRQQFEAERQQFEAERQQAEAERQQAEAERQQAEAERQQAEAERQQAEAERQQAEAERQQAMLRLHRQYAMSAKQIAEVMNLPLKLVRKALTEASPPSE